MSGVRKAAVDWPDGLKTRRLDRRLPSHGFRNCSTKKQLSQLFLFAEDQEGWEELQIITGREKVKEALGSAFDAIPTTGEMV